MSRVVVGLIVLLVTGCGTGHTVRTQDRDPNTVEAADVARRDLHRVEEMLRGQVAGVEVRQGPRGLVIRIRQAGGFMTTSEPLFVIDGLPITLGADGALDGINPHDVASIQVLKSVSETALYGSRGANGVVLITTVRPPPPPAAEPAPVVVHR